MYGILRAEVRRGFNHRVLVVFIGATLLACILALSFQIFGILENSESEAVKEAFRDAFAFPNFIFFALGICQFLFIFLIPTGVGVLVGQDYQLNTWKMILPRTPQRGLLLISKSLNVLILLAFLFLIALSSVLVCGMFFAFWLDTSMAQNNSELLSLDNQISLLRNLSFIFWYVSVSVLLTIISRSVIVAASVSLVFFLLCVSIQAYSPEYLSIWFAPTHFNNLVSVPIDEAVTNKAFRPNVSPIVSWAVVGFHIVGNFIGSYIVLVKQDFSGN